MKFARTRRPPPTAPFFTGRYIQHGGGLLDFIKRGWSTLSKVYQTAKPLAKKGLTYANSLPEVQQLKQDAKKAGRKAIQQFGQDVISGENVKQSLKKRTAQTGLNMKTSLKRAGKQGLNRVSKGGGVKKAGKKLTPAQNLGLTANPTIPPGTLDKTTKRGQKRSASKSKVGNPRKKIAYGLLA